MATKFNSKIECEAAIANRGNTSAVWVGPVAAKVDGVQPGWYAYCNDFRRLLAC